MENIDKRITSLIKICFESFRYRLREGKYEAEFLDGLEPPPPIYDDIECAKNGRYIKCQREEKDPFYSWFVPAKEKNKPLLTVIPGYEAQLRSYPDVSDRFNLLFISPLGYSTPYGFNRKKAYGKTWPVLYNTICGFEDGYYDWIADAITVIDFIGRERLADTDKLIFSGTSQGGAMSLILASFYGSERCMAACADLPFLLGCSTRKLNSYIYEFPPPPDIRFRPSEAKKRLSIVDPEWHKDRLHMPLLVTASDIDRDCPLGEIVGFFDSLPSTTSRVYLRYDGRPHGYSSIFFKDMLEFFDEMKEDGFFGED